MIERSNTKLAVCEAVEPMTSNPYAALPRVDAVLAAAEDLVGRFGHAAVRDGVREELERARVSIRDGKPAPSPEQVLLEVERRVSLDLRVGPRRVINAAGVVVHTNLGRAPLSARAIAAMVQAAGYTDLEVDLTSGGRGTRGGHVDSLLARSVGAADAMVVNNCAAALVLVLAALAHGRRVVVSRAHLVEIGGSFRLPDIMASSGAVLLEAGTTNRTRATDYSSGDDVAALLTVHPSNFTQEGFVAQPSLSEVAAIARGRGVPLIHDAGSGLLDHSDHPGLADEPTMAASLADGADLVLASGDKLLGGPQAGLIAGREDLIRACRRHPLARALRLDKLRLAALSATLVDHLSGARGSVETLLSPDEDLPRRAQALASIVGGTVAESLTLIGGGCAPGVGVPSPVVRVTDPHPNQLAAALRRCDPPIVARVDDGAVVVDLRTVNSSDDAYLGRSLAAAMDRPSPAGRNQK